jgi:hypothetical protein
MQTIIVKIFPGNPNKQQIITIVRRNIFKGSLDIIFNLLYRVSIALFITTKYLKYNDVYTDKNVGKA